MTPIDFARNLARSGELRDQALGVAIVTRGLTDDDPETQRQGWPLDESTARLAARYIGITQPGPVLLRRAVELAPTVSDAMLNRAAR